MKKFHTDKACHTGLKTSSAPVGFVINTEDWNYESPQRFQRSVASWKNIMNGTGAQETETERKHRGPVATLRVSSALVLSMMFQTLSKHELGQSLDRALILLLSFSLVILANTERGKGSDGN